MLSLQFSTPINISFSSHNHISNYKPFLLSAHYCTADQTRTKYGPNDHFANSSNSCLLRFCLAAGKSKCASNSEIENEKINQQTDELPGGLDPELVPKHVAIIMDGNRRWAKNRGLNPQDGHKAGKEALRVISAALEKHGVKVLSVFAFSTENWTRPKEEVDFLMKLLEEILQTDYEDQIRKHDVRVTVLGDRSRLPQSVQNVICSTEERIKDNKGPRSVVAMNYGGRYDITQATKMIARKVKDGVLQVEDIDENLFGQHLETSRLEFPSPDLLKRSKELAVN